MSISLLSLSGPIMVGPSSSHTAGALKIGKLALGLYGKKIEKVRIYLHGSFADVYKGHATDKAILSGLLGLETDDSNIINAFEIAKKENLSYEFIPTNLGDRHHPNTARIEIMDPIKKDKKPLVITGASVGGGAIRLTGINEFPLNFKEPNGNTYTIIIVHNDKRGILNMLTTLLMTQNNNIASIHSERQKKDGEALTIIETDEQIEEKSIKELQAIDDIQAVFALK